ncbi:hypothetical protein [Alteromonas sp. ASW11-130]|uniref:hypothetical protein n=1 Tax=Alteromonas sp. ASW11-130 TaxID=3015775 RepID=UPI0022426A69|nr:hypothetical protein [Alteromonas sp. ASW11-130]MCW8091866.1 hypothetical protein [Alteromonas sp. ASW11-130]
MKRFLLGLAILFSSSSNAGFHYCSGKIKDLITRATIEETQVVLENMQGYARLSYGGDAMNEMHQRQFSMLLAAYLSNEPVVLEFVSDSGVDSCDDNHDGFPIRYVRLRR